MSEDRIVDELRRTRHSYPRFGWGTDAALLVVDMQNDFVRIGGAAAIAPMQRMSVLLSQFRATGWPVFYARISTPDLSGMNQRWGTLGDMSPYVDGRESASIHESLEPAPGETVLAKTHASSFYGTQLDARLGERGTDTLVIIGNTTSGCVRATAVDSSARSLHTIVVEDAVFDHRTLSGEVALNDLAERYADVVRTEEVVQWLAK